MRTDEINIRDPYVLAHNGKYYMYGSRAYQCWGVEAYGLDVYVSEDLENWSEPKEIFTRTPDFWATKEYWAPEVHYYNGAFYMFVSFKAEGVCRGTQILRSEAPDKPFSVHSEVITPKEWECLDGTLYVEDGVPYMIFCHEWVQVTDGEMCAIKLKNDLSAADGEPILLFKASEPAWSCASSIGGYVTDGPFMVRLSDGALVMIWSSFGEHGYVEAVARSESGSITGTWRHDTDAPLFDENSGHGMIFDTFDGRKMLVLHSPNTPYLDERPKFFEIEERNGHLVIKK